MTKYNGLFDDDYDFDFYENRDIGAFGRSTDVDYICECPNPKCEGYGERSLHGFDEFCPFCGAELDWENEEPKKGL